MIYECIEDFWVEQYDDDGFSVENEYVEIKAGSVWESSSESIIGGEVHLDKCGKDAFSWIEISKSHLTEYFEELQNMDKCPLCGRALHQHANGNKMKCVRCKWSREIDWEG